MEIQDAIRKVTESDASALCELMRELGDERLSREDMLDRIRMASGSLTDTIYVWEQESLVKGALVFRVRENYREVGRYGEIGIIVVKSEEKRKGICTKLMAFAEGRARELGCKATYLISGFGRKDEAHPFYLELGYEITGYRFVKPIDRRVENELSSIS